MFLAVLLLVTYNALWRSRVTATADRLTVVNGYRTRHYEWSQVIAVSLRRGRPWATADLSDGTTVSLFGRPGLRRGPGPAGDHGSCGTLIATQTPPAIP